MSGPQNFECGPKFISRKGEYMATVIGMKYQIAAIEKEHGGRTDESRRLRRRKIELEIEELLSLGKKKEAAELRKEL
jgi:hypothetical protein